MIVMVRICVIIAINLAGLRRNPLHPFNLGGILTSGGGHYGQKKYENLP